MKTGIVIGVWVVFAAWGVEAQDGAPECPRGQVVNADTAERCCWPGQVWHSGRGRCVGIPLMCPEGMVPSAEEACVEASERSCPEGRVATRETSGACCWAGQAWSSLRERCVGVPTSCPKGAHVEGEACVRQETGVVMVTTAEPGAEVRVDGERVGETPLSLTLPVGEASLEVELGSGTESMTIEVVSGERLRVALGI